MKKIELTLACGDYEIVRPLKEGIVKPDGIDLIVLTGMDSTTRHWRFLRNGDFDMSETSASSYVVARDYGYPITALPVFLHRRFRHGFVYVNTSKGIETPKDLIGRKVGIKSFLVTAGHWMRGILEHEYGVPHKSIDWYAELDEDVDFEPPADLKLTRLPDDKSVERMLAEGELDAVIHSSLIKPILEKDPRVARLFPDYKAEEQKYFAKTGIFPIMHVLGLRNEVVEKYPWVPVNMFNAFQEAKKIAMKRMENPRIVPLAWYREAWEEQEAILGPDPWEYGLTERNRHTLETLAGYSHEQGLIRRPARLDELFVDVSQGRKRGDEFRI
ncbi:ABC transporter substrate-binding protein [Rhodovulum sp. 12E13]|uniref:ABC transporter substrate-binding protein n=1 Tax=Rhodovulum sp. 12E13 TaxID=2203891 RepID=UPI001314C417|nr:ABC transporter substrate-binding protein [Rhodovulum sp. 12E13]